MLPAGMPSSRDALDPSAFHLAVADARAVRWLRGSRTAAGRLHLQETARLDEQWEEKEHHRPLSLTPHPDGHSYAGLGHVEEERLQRFAKEAARWVGEQAAAQRAGRVHLFAAPRMLGALRKQLSGALAARVEDAAHDLGRLTVGEIAEHPAVKAIPAGDERRMLDERLGRD